MYLYLYTYKGEYVQYAHDRENADKPPNYCILCPVSRQANRYHKVSRPPPYGSMATSPLGAYDCCLSKSPSPHATIKYLVKYLVNNIAMVNNYG